MPQGNIKFVVAKKDINISSGATVDKDDVGIIQSESADTAAIFFVRAWQRVELNKRDFKQFKVEQTGDGFSKKICNICHKLLAHRIC